MLNRLKVILVLITFMVTISIPLIPQVSAANVYLREPNIKMEFNQVSAAGWFHVSYQVPSGHAAGSTIQVDLPAGFVILSLLDFNDVTVLINDVAVTTAASASTTAWGFTRNTATRFTVTVDTDTAVANNGQMDIVLGDHPQVGGGKRDNAVTNSSIASTEADPHIVTITPSATYSATKAAIAITSDTTVALQTVVLPHLTMTLSDTDHSLGELDETNIISASNTITIDTNAANGWELYYAAEGLANEDGNGIILAANAGSTAVAGSEEWGINLKDNATPNVGLEPSVTGAPGTSNALTIASGYGTVDSYKVVNSGARTLMASRNGSTDAQILTISYVATAATTTPAGNYSGTVAFIVIGLF